MQDDSTVSNADINYFISWCAATSTNAASPQLISVYTGAARDLSVSLPVLEIVSYGEM